jgi:hypothetical protein
VRPPGYGRLTNALPRRALRCGARCAAAPQARAVFVGCCEFVRICSLLLPLRLAAVRRPRMWVAVAPNLNKRSLTMRVRRVRCLETSGRAAAASLACQTQMPNASRSAAAARPPGCARSEQAKKECARSEQAKRVRTNVLDKKARTWYNMLVTRG